MHVVEVPWAEVGLPVPAAGEQGSGEHTDLHALVAAVRAAAGNVALPPRPWLNPLPARLTAAELERPAPLRLPYALEDRPAEQRRSTAVLDLEAGGHLLVVGAARSGRTTLLHTLAAALSTATSPSDAHLYALDCGGGALQPLTGLAHTGAVVTDREPDRVHRLLARLATEVARRQELLAAHGWSDLAEQRASSAEPLPYLLLLLDRWEGFLSTFGEVDGGRLPETLLRLLREGPSVGLRIVVTGDRSALVGRLAQAVEQVVVLRLADRSDYALAGLPPRRLPRDIGDGRGFRDGVELQVALPLTLGATAPVGSRARPFRIDPLPARISWADAQALPCEPCLPVAVGGDELGLLGIDLAQHGPGFTIAGPPRSGRSTALTGLAHGLVAAGTTAFAVTPRPSPLRSLSGVVPVTEAAQLVRLLNETTGPVAVLVDDAELLADDPVADVLSQVLRDGRDTGHALVLAGSTHALGGAARGFAAQARTSRSGLLLGLTSHLDAELLGTRLPRSAVTDGPLGRGFLIRGGWPTLVQVPC